MENRDKIVVLLAGGRLVQRHEAHDNPELSDEELYALLPEDVKAHAVFQKWSTQPPSNYTLRMCSDIISMASGYIHDEGARGVVITCGIQALAELAYLPVSGESQRYIVPRRLGEHTKRRLREREQSCPVEVGDSQHVRRSIY